MLKMMMQGRHEEDPTACPFKIYDLQDDGYATDDKHNAEQRNKQQISRKMLSPPRKPPSDSEPVSPINTRALFVLKHKNPRDRR